jgi:hypothetical protein
MTATPRRESLTVAGVRWIVALVLPLAACGADRAAPPAAPANRAASAPAAPPAAPTPDRRCLPVVADACGCVYTCGVGVRVDAGWTVTHPFWGDEPLAAQLGRFCVGDACTEAFHVELVCDGICAPRAADATCHFDDRGACVGAAS